MLKKENKIFKNLYNEFGWEIEKNSWGYVVQRCNYLGIPIVQALSRCPLSRINGNNGHDMTGGDPDGTIRIHGRIVLSMWRLVKSEATLKLNNYSMENVAFELLRLRVPRYPQNSLAHWRELCVEQFLSQASIHFLCNS